MGYLFSGGFHLLFVIDIATIILFFLPSQSSTFSWFVYCLAGKSVACLLAWLITVGLLMLRMFCTWTAQCEWLYNHTNKQQEVDLQHQRISQSRFIFVWILWIHQNQQGFSYVIKEFHPKIFFYPLYTKTCCNNMIISKCV